MIRISGPDARGVLERIMDAGARLPEVRRATVLSVRDPDEGVRLDQVVVTRYEGPESYTGEDLVELSCHGGWVGPAEVLEACLRAGARLAEPGEFTRRAYLNGKLDLTQVEAVADLVEARSRVQRRAALKNLDRGLSERVSNLREALTGVEALLVHHLDFPEEDDAPVGLEEVVRAARTVLDAVRRLVATAPEGELLREGALTVLAGAPNAGKSSLYNALIGEARAIVTEEPGTTRDALEAVVEIGGYPFRLVDTAGLRADVDRVEALGIEVALRYLERADLVLYCVDAADGVGSLAGGAGVHQGESGASDPAPLDWIRARAEAPVVVVETKVDTLGSEGAAAGFGEAHSASAGQLSSAPGADGSGGGPVGTDATESWGASRDPDPGAGAPRLRVSAVSGEGMDALRALLPRLVFEGTVASGGEVPVLMRRRQAHHLESAAAELEAFCCALEAGVPPEAAAAHLSAAGTALEEVLGVISLDDVLDRVFRDFCVGK